MSLVAGLVGVSCQRNPRGKDRVQEDAEADGGDGTDGNSAYFSTQLNMSLLEECCPKLEREPEKKVRLLESRCILSDATCISGGE